MHKTIPIDYPRRRWFKKLSLPMWLWRLLALIATWWLFASSFYGTYCLLKPLWP
jgi:hypothetical protein